MEGDALYDLGAPVQPGTGVVPLETRDALEIPNGRREIRARPGLGWRCCPGRFQRAGVCVVVVCPVAWMDGTQWPAGGDSGIGGRPQCVGGGDSTSNSPQANSPEPKYSVERCINPLGGRHLVRWAFKQKSKTRISMPCAMAPCRRHHHPLTAEARLTHGSCLMLHLTPNAQCRVFGGRLAWLGLAGPG